MKKYIFSAIVFAAITALAVASFYNEKAHAVDSLRMDSTTGQVSIDGKTYTKLNYTPALISNLSKCQKSQQSDMGGYVYYQILGWSNGKCVYQTISNTAMFATGQTKWVVSSKCTFSPSQLREYSSAMKNPKGNVAKRTAKLKNGDTFTMTASYFDFLDQIYLMDGVCK